MDWFTAAGSVFQGMYDKSKQYQKEDFIIRAEELKAEKDSIINRKNKKYDLELNSYYKELEKKKEIDSLNSEFKQLGKSGNVNDYASKYLAATDKYWGTYSEDERKARTFKLATDIQANDGKIFNYEMQSNDPDKLANDLAAEEKLILKNYKNELQKSKDNNFLVNKVLGKSTEVNENAINDAVNAEKKVSKFITKTEDGSSEEFKLSGTAKRPDIKIKPDFDKAFGSQRTKLVFDSVADKGNAVEFLLASNLIGADGSGFYKFKNGEVTESTAAGKMVMNIYKKTYNQILENQTVEDYAALDPQQRVGNIGVNFSKDKIHALTIQAIEQRAINLDNTEWFDGKKDIKAVIHLPFNVLDMNSQINGKDYKGAEVKTQYENFIRDVVSNKNMQTKAISKLDTNTMAAQIQNSIQNDGVYKDQFLKYLDSKGIKPIETESAIEGVAEVKTDEVPKVEGNENTNLDKETSSANFKIGINKDNINSLIVPFNDAIPGRVEGDKIPLTPSNIEKLKSLNNEEINALISEGVKYGVDKNKNAPNLNTIPEFITITGTRGIKRKIPNPEHPKNKIKIPPKNTSKVNKTKIR